MRSHQLHLSLVSPCPSVFHNPGTSRRANALRSAWPQVNVEKYGEWIQLVAEFTVSSLHSWQWASGSVYYLLGLWSRLVSSMPYLKSESPSLLETYVPNITEAYITSRSAVLQAFGALDVLVVKF